MSLLGGGMVESFEYGRDIAILYGSLRSAERILRKQGSVSKLNADECVVFCQTVYNGIQSAYKGNTEREIVDERLQCALLCCTLVSSDILAKEDLEYFESILDNAPVITFRVYFALIELCKWEKQSIQSLQALPIAIRLAFLAKSIQYVAESPHNWYCIMLVLTWSAYIEIYQDSSHYENSSHRAFSSLNARHVSQEGTDAGESLQEPSHSNRSAQLSEMLMACMNCVIDTSSPRMEPWAVLTSVFTLVSEFLRRLLRPTQYSSEAILRWNAETFQGDDLYLSWPPEYECNPDVVMLVLKSSEDRFLEALCGFLNSEEANHLILADREYHAHCRIDGFCVTNQEISLASKDPSLFHAVGMLSRSLNAVCQCVPPDLVLSLKSIQRLKDLCDKHSVEVPAFSVDCDVIVENVAKCLGCESLKNSDVLLWVLSEDNVIKHNRIVESLCSHLALLSHPACFPRLVDRVRSVKESGRLKQLLIEACDAAPVKIQRAMLRYCLAYCSNVGAFKTDNFEEQLVERINRISSYTEGETKEPARFASLCLQDTSRVIRELVSLAVRDGCIDVVSEILKAIRPACCHKSDHDPEKSVLELELERNFVSELQRPSKSNGNFVQLIVELGQSDLLECKAFVKYVMHYVELGGSRNQFPDECFPLKTIAAMSSKIPKDYKAPTLLMISQLLDDACIHLNALRKEQIISVLETCIPDLLTPSGDAAGQLRYLEDMLRPLSDTCHVALCRALRAAKLEDCCLYATLLGMAEKHPLLQTADEWKATCTVLCTEHEGRTAIEVTLPYFCLWLAGATSDEWEVLSERIVEAVSHSRNGSTTVIESVRALTNCVAGCARFFHVANWGHFFSCFARVVKEWLQKAKLEDQDRSNVVQELLFVLSIIPESCRQQGLILLLDVTQFLDAKLKDGVTSTIKETLALAESPELFAAAVDGLGDSIFRQLSLGPG